MRNTMRWLMIAVAVWMSCNLWADGTMYTWRAHLSYGSVEQVAYAGATVYALSGGALFSVDAASSEVTTWSKMDGLHGADIVQIVWVEKAKSLLIVYKDGLMDVISEKGIEPLSDLQIKQMNASKEANHAVEDEGKVYLSMPFGIVVVNVVKHEIADTWYIGAGGSEVNVAAVALTETAVYAMTKDTIYTALRSANLLDYSYWTRMPQVRGENVLHGLAAYKDSVYALRDQAMYVWTGAQWSQRCEGLPVTRLRRNGGKVYAFTPDRVWRVDDNGNWIPLSQPIAAVDAAGGNGYWLAARAQGLIWLTEEGTQTYRPEGPLANMPYSLTIANGRLYVVPGGRWAVQYNRQGIVMVYDVQDDHWWNISEDDIMAKTGNSTRDFMNVAVDPLDPEHFFVTSYGTGLYEFKDMQLLKRYMPNNSSIISAVESVPEFYTRTDGAIYDRDGNLLFLNTDPPPYNLHVVSPTALQTAHRVDSSGWFAMNLYDRKGERVVIHTAQRLLQDARKDNWIWVPLAREDASIFLLDNNGTPFYTGDDRTMLRGTFSDQDGNTITPTAIYTMVQDKKNDMWVALQEGLIVIPANVDFMTSDHCERIKIPRNDGTNLADYLLQTERINAIAVDGANRKWIGTEGSGLYLMSEDGLETIEHFTADNSPLPSDQILSIAIEPITGRVFVGTSEGLMSYQSDAAEPAESLSSAYAYPNPVRPDYEGVVTITGLMDETMVYILDNGGNLVCKTRSNGGLATWNCRTGDGRRVASGVYSALCNTSSGSKHTVVKILVMN